MTEKFLQRMTAALLAAVFAVSVAACTGSSPTPAPTAAPTPTPAPAATTAAATPAPTPEPPPEPEQLPLLTYTYFVPSAGGTVQDFISRPDDVVSPYIEERFGIKLGDVIESPRDMTFDQVITLWGAAGQIPDVVHNTSDYVPMAARTGFFADLTPYVEIMPNYQRAYPKKYWNRSNVDGKQYAIQRVELYEDPPIPDAEDPFSTGVNAHAIWVREDVLNMLNFFEFEPAASIRARTSDVGIKPTVEDLKMEPTIETPEQLYMLLMAIKDLNLTINGLPVAPFSMRSWHVHHLGCMFDFGYWRIDAAGDVEGYFASPGTYDYMKWLNLVYRNDLIDKDYIIETGPQYAEKVASGRVAAGMANIPDLVGTFQALKTVVPEADVRFIPWPKMDPDLGFYDVVAPEAYYVVMVSDSVPSDKLDRIMEYWEWLYSDEGQDLISWGPESAGLWEIRDGVKKFIDPQIEYDMLNRVRDANGADKYGLSEGAMMREKNFCPIVLASGAGLNYQTFFRSYPAVVNFDEVSKNIFGAAGLNFKGSGAMLNGDPIVESVADWYWDEFLEKDIGKILNAKTDAEFEAAYAEIKLSHDTKVDYPEAQRQMVEWFEMFPPYK